MRSGKLFPMSARAMIWAAWPRKPAQHLMGSLGCSPRQAWRIVSTGKVPSVFRQKLITLLDEAIAANERDLRQLRRELRDLEDGKSPRALAPADSLERVSVEDVATLPGLDRRPT